MGASGFPFPPSLGPQLPEVDTARRRAAQNVSSCSPSVFPLAVHHHDFSPCTVPSLGDVRDSSLLPSVLSPSVQPSARAGPSRAMNVGSPSEPALSIRALSASSPASHLHLRRDFSSPFVAADSLALPTPPYERSLQIRLPAFDKLGIANPHSDCIPLDPSNMIMRSPGFFQNLASDSMGSAAFGNAATTAASLNDSLDQGSDNRKQRHPGTIHAPGSSSDVSTWTPPDELITFDWGMSSISMSEPEQVNSGHDMTTSGMASPTTEQPSESLAFPTPDDSEVDEQEKWLDDAIEQIISCIDPTNLTGHTMRILSHALPSPSTPGHSFPRVVEALRDRLPGAPLMFINLLHAVPGRFNLSDLPTSPPSTPGQPLGSSNGTGEDYFTAKIFEAAVTAIDYASSQGMTATSAAGSPTGQPNTSQPNQHFPLVAPSSLHFSIVERFIPPSSRNEFVNLFSLSRPSLVVDRLIELLPGNGCLALIYPTRAGAETFCTKYLGPILDPLLRSMVVVNNFSADLSTAIGRMAAVEHMHDFETMNRKLTELCDELRRGATSNPQVRQRLQGDSGDFSVIYSCKKKVTLERQAWTEWYMKQEKTRVRNAVALHFRYGNRYTADTDTTPTHLIQEIFGGVGTKMYPAGREPTGPDARIEVGVFVIKRGR